MSGPSEITVDDLIEKELDGKSEAIHKYDEMIWKIRAGYSIFLYGAIGTISAFSRGSQPALSAGTAVASCVLMFGFSAFAALLDYSFMGAKLRVVEYRDELVELAHKKAESNALGLVGRQRLVECLKNSGERRDRVDWSRRAGRWVPPLYYGGTFLVCSTAAVILYVIGMPEA